MRTSLSEFGCLPVSAMVHVHTRSACRKIVAPMRATSMALAGTDHWIGRLISYFVRRRRQPGVGA